MKIEIFCTKQYIFIGRFCYRTPIPPTCLIYTKPLGLQRKYLRYFKIKKIFKFPCYSTSRSAFLRLVVASLYLLKQAAKEKLEHTL